MAISSFWLFIILVKPVKVDAEYSEPGSKCLTSSFFIYNLHMNSFITLLPTWLALMYISLIALSHMHAMIV